MEEIDAVVAYEEFDALLADYKEFVRHTADPQ